MPERDELERADRGRRRRALARPGDRQGRPPLPFDAIELAETTEGARRSWSRRSSSASRIAVVSDVNTVEVMGRRVARALRPSPAVDEVVMPDGLDCDEATDRGGRRADPPCRRRRRGRLGRPQRQLQARHLPRRPALCRVRHRRLDERLWRLDRLGDARVRPEDVAALACAARHLPRPRRLGGGADLAQRRRARRLPLPLDRADRLVGLAPAVRHLLFDDALCAAGGRRGADARRAPAGLAAARHRGRSATSSAC